MPDMTETEFATRIEDLGVQRGRLQVAMELSHFAAYHPAVLTSPIANEFAKDIVERCQQIIGSVKGHSQRHADS